MNSRRDFLKTSGALAIGSILLPNPAEAANRKTVNAGVQLYTVRKVDKIVM